MFDLRTEAEMRLHSEKTAKELAVLKKQREEAVENNTAPQTPPRAEEEHGPTPTPTDTTATRKPV